MPDTHVIDESTGCWIWQGRWNASGYGYLRHEGQQWAAHRWYYTQAKGPIPDGLALDHLCRVRSCVNPDHLEPVTLAENTRRGAEARLPADDLGLRRAIREAADKRAGAEAARAQAMAELAGLARRAVDLGVPIAVIARDAHLSRPSLYALIKGS